MLSRQPCVWRNYPLHFIAKTVKLLQRASFLLLAVVLLTACEARIEIKVLVLDQLSLLPIDSVFVDVVAGKNGDFTKSGTKGYTDSSGRMESSMMIGCSGGCYDYKITYSKEGYRSITEENTLRDTVY